MLTQCATIIFHPIQHRRLHIIMRNQCNMFFRRKLRLNRFYLNSLMEEDRHFLIHLPNLKLFTFQTGQYQYNMNQTNSSRSS